MEIKVRALRTGYDADNKRRRGDKELGEGQGDVFVLRDREIAEYDVRTSRILYDENNKPKTRILTAEQQFSPIWMERVDDSAPERTTGSPDALSATTGEIRAGKRSHRR